MFDALLCLGFKGDNLLALSSSRVCWSPGAGLQQQQQEWSSVKMEKFFPPRSAFSILNNLQVWGGYAEGCRGIF